MYDYAVYIGRFEPFHSGHLAVLRQAYQVARRVIMLVGSSNLHRSPKNPWTFEERKKFIEMSVKDTDLGHGLTILPLNDIPYNDTAWVTQVRQLVSGAVSSAIHPSIVSKGCLIGFKKDASSYYLDMLSKEWDLVQTKQFGVINATDIRNSYLQETPTISNFLAGDVCRLLSGFIKTDTYKWLLDEQQFLVSYREKWGPGPFYTADNVVVQSGRILLVTRKLPPYRGALALPGGFINPYERIIDAAVRELTEETRISDDRGELPAGVLQSFIKDKRGVLFDDPDRSARARIITHAYKYELPDNKQFYVRGDDDAEKAQWYPLDQLDPRQFMEDHWFIIQEMTGINWK
jgi:bifunctional NMN adenylyltransferase/nudix hydrolase